MSAATESLTRLRDQAAVELASDEPGWIDALRRTAFESFLEQGFPTRRLESWKGTNFAAVEKFDFHRVATEETNPVVVTGDGTPELDFVDGRLETANSQAANLPHGVRLTSLAEARRQSPEILEGRLGALADPKSAALVALQTAFLDDGAVLVIDSGTQLDTPIRFRFAVRATSDAASTASFPRLLVVAGENSRVSIVLEHETRGAPEQSNSESEAGPNRAPGLTAFVAEYFLAAGARLETVQIQSEDASRVHFTSAHARLDAGAQLDSHVFSLSPGLVRSELDILLAEPGARVRMRGFFLGREKAHIDHFTTVDHAAESCESDQEYRGVLADASAGVFRGRVIVRPGAQKTDARQSNPNLLLSEKASIDSKPQLEIYADDIKASHGSTTGQLDEDALFFLRARGIDEANAKLMLTRAFATSIVDGIEDDSIRSSVANRVEASLERLVSASIDSVGSHDATDRPAEKLP